MDNLVEDNARPATPSSDGEGVVELAVYDFDGTSIDGNSPVLLVRKLARKRMLKLSVIARILLWAAAYKLRLPQSEAWVRGLVFRAFRGRPKEEVDRFLSEFYDEVIAPRFRDAAEASMREHQKAGRVVVVVSASFEPILIQAQKGHPFDFQVSTRMVCDETGAYTCRVEGAPVEGDEKPRAIRRFADARYGKGGWKVTHAYGDHHSDRPMLRMAEHPVAVSPDSSLRRTALKNGWEIADWK